MSSRNVRRLVITLVALMSLAAVIWYVTRPEPVVVAVAVIEKGRVESSVANTRAGTVEAERRARLAPSVGGRVARLLVGEGDRVEEGALLMELWNKDLKAKLKLAESELAAAKARYEEACSIAEVAEREAARLLKLRTAGIESEERVDAVVADAKAKKAACTAQAATVKVSESRIALAEATLEETFLHAPFGGIIAEVNTELGEFVTPSPPGIPTQPAIDLIDDRSLYVVAPIDEVDAPSLNKGLPARVTLDAFAGRTFSGTVRRVAPYIFEREKQARTVDVEVSLVAEENVAGLLVGYSADIEIVLATRDDVVRVPTEALLEGHRVLVLPAGGEVLEERSLEVGISNWKFTEVRSGIAPGERVVVSLERTGVVPGAQVIPEETSGDKK